MDNEQKYRAEFDARCENGRSNANEWQSYLAACRAREAECDALRMALEQACTALRNDFEPDNQSRAWHAANAALAKAKEPTHET